MTDKPRPIDVAYGTWFDDKELLVRESDYDILADEYETAVEVLGDLMSQVRKAKSPDVNVNMKEWRDVMDRANSILVTYRGSK